MVRKDYSSDSQTRTAKISVVRLELYIIWAQSFTSLKADLRQDINGGFVSRGALMEHFHEESAPLSLL